MRIILRLCLGLAVVSALAQAWVTGQWIGNLDMYCDYPDDCLAAWLPRAFAVAEYLWMATLGLGVVALVVSLLLRRSVVEIVVDLVILGVALAAAFYSYWMTPMVQTMIGTPVTDQRHLVEGIPYFWSGSGYSDAAQLMAISATFFLGQLLRSLMMDPAPSRASTKDYHSPQPSA